LHFKLVTLIAQSVVQSLSMQAVLKRLFVTVAQDSLELLVRQEQLALLVPQVVVDLETEHDLVLAHLASVLAMTT
jgi:hypothetical protein